MIHEQNTPRELDQEHSNEPSTPSETDQVSSVEQFTPAEMEQIRSFERGLKRTLLILLILAASLFITPPERRFFEPDLAFDPIAPALISTLCEEIRENQEIEEAHEPELIPEMETALAALKDQGELPSEVLHVLDGYLHNIKALEKAGRLELTASSSAMSRVYMKRRTDRQGTYTCAVATIRDSGDGDEGENESVTNDEQTIGNSYHEGVHAVLDALDSQDSRLLPEDLEESYAYVYGELITYGARLSGASSNEKESTFELFGLDAPQAVYQLTVLGFPPDHPLYKYLHDVGIAYISANTIQTYFEVIELQEQRQQLELTPFAATLLEKELANTHSLLEEALQDQEEYFTKWRNYEWTEDEMSAMQSLVTAGIAAEGFFSFGGE